jgi:hypothetical protein
VKPGAALVREALDSPLLEPCWLDDILDWDLVEKIEGQLSGGEQAVIEVARSLDGQGTTHLWWALAAMDGRCRDLTAATIVKVAEGMLR